MFDHFDFSLLDNPEFKEDSVREEIVLPIIKRLGYELTGPNRIVRSKSLLHPFVMIGSKKHPIHIIPDYLLYGSARPGLVIDAKKPNEKLIKTKHVEQAYSYAIHPEVRVRFYALCNGRSIVAYDIYGIEPVFQIPLENVDRDWNVINSVLCPDNTSFMGPQELAPDLGVCVFKMGCKTGDIWIFNYAAILNFGRISEIEYTMTVNVRVGETDHMASLDASPEMFAKILEFTDSENRDFLNRALTPGQNTFALRPIYLTIETTVGSPTRGQHDVFVPFVVRNVQKLDENDYNEMLASYTENAE